MERSTVGWNAVVEVALELEADRRGSARLVKLVQVWIVPAESIETNHGRVPERVPSCSSRLE